MAKFVADNYAITINGTNFSTSLASVELSIEADDVETTSFGGSGYRTRVGGLKAANISLEFHQESVLRLHRVSNAVHATQFSSWRPCNCQRFVASLWHRYPGNRLTIRPFRRSLRNEDEP